MPENKRKNTAYIFVPFAYEDEKDFKKIHRLMESNARWDIVHDEIRYMLKYVAEKLDSRKKETCQCFHYELKAEAFASYGLPEVGTQSMTQPHKYKGKDVRFGFNISSVQLYSFTTTIGILTFRVEFESSDPMWISNAMYYLKKASREPICLSEQDEVQMSFLEISKNIMQRACPDMVFDYFFYANEGTERANAFMYIEVDEKEDYTDELFHLRRCCGEGFTYQADLADDERELFYTAPDIMWGVSAEAAVVLVCPDMGRADFLYNKFCPNFNKQYLYMYILLLHQKYVLYMFRTRIGRGKFKELQELEMYRKRLFEFENDFVFTTITEVPQYQFLYDKMVNAFVLKPLFEDVCAPILSLGDTRKGESEKRVNRSLFGLSILAVFSALVDSYDFCEKLGDGFFNSTMSVGQIVCIVIIFGILVYTIGSSIYNYFRDNM